MSLPEEWAWRPGPGGLGATWKGRTLTSSYAPYKDALRHAQNAPKAALFVLLGWGTGHLGHALAEHYPESVVLALEPNDKRCEAAQQHPEWSSLSQHPRLVLWNQNEVPYAWLMGFPPTKTHILIHPALEEEPDIKNLAEACHVFLDRQRVNVRTLKRFAPLWGRNLQKNLDSHQLESASIWSNTYKNRSLLIAAAGPSLEDGLKEFLSLSQRNEVTLIAVDSAHPALFANGIVPDFVISMDAQYWNARHLDSLSTENLVVELVSHPSLIQRHRGRVFVVGSSIPPVADLEQKRFPKLASGGSVSTASASFAQLLGAEAVLWLGLDLAWHHGRTHARPGLVEALFHSRAHRTKTLDTESLQNSLNQARVWMEGSDGKRFLVDQRLFLYALWLDEAQQNHIIPQSHRLLPKTRIPQFTPAKHIVEFLNRFPSTRVEAPPTTLARISTQDLELLRKAWFDWRNNPKLDFPQRLERTWTEWIGPVHASRQRFALPPLEQEFEERCAIIDAFFYPTTLKEA